VSLLLAERVDIRIDREAFIRTTIQQTIRGYVQPAASTASTADA
jgi:hypothetical protein